MDSLHLIIEEIDCYLDAIEIKTLASCKEHALINHLAKLGVEPFIKLDLHLSKDLFCAHFLTHHALYQLQDQYYTAKTHCLSIDLTEIKRMRYSRGLYDITKHDPLKSYYLDISHYFETEASEVNELLNNFWRKYLAQDDKLNALKILGLDANADYSCIKKKYRSLAQKEHPDKGGDNERFAKISAAKSILDRIYL